MKKLSILATVFLLLTTSTGCVGDAMQTVTDHTRDVEQVLKESTPTIDKAIEDATKAITENAPTIDEVVKAVKDQKGTLEYTTGILDETLPLTLAHLELQSLYTDPLGYTPTEWQQAFDKNDDIIESSYENIKILTPPPSLAEVHKLLLLALENTIKVNDLTESTIASGGSVTEELTKQYENANQSYQDIQSQLNQLQQIINLGQ